MEKDFKAIDHGKGPIDMTGYPSAVEFKPIELHHKEDGAKDNSPSFAILLENPAFEVQILGQISLETLAASMSALGYTLTKNEL